MRVMLTGGTGFIGGHVLKALVDAGHEPRLLVRSTSKLEQMCELQQIDGSRITHVVGDILDRASVDEALEGCDACIHAAAFTSLDPVEMPKALDVNEPGARTVLDAAIAAGCDPIVHVSTMSVIFPPTGDRLSAYDPIHGGGAPYNESKADAEVYARDLQDQGKPIVIVYPAGCTAPLDLGVNVMENMLNQILTAEFVMTAESGGYLMIDSRDAARAIAALLQPGKGPRRYMIGGNYLDWDGFADLLETVTGVARQRILTPRSVLETTLDKEAVDIMFGIVSSDDDALLRDTGLSWRPLSETLRDTISWMVAQGRLDPKWAGTLA